MHALLLEVEEALELLGRGGEGGGFFTVGRGWGWRVGDGEVRDGGHGEVAEALAGGGVG